MYNIDQMSQTVKRFCSQDQIFDNYRLVDPASHRVYDYIESDDRLVMAETFCFSVWKRKYPCANCISRHTCLEEKEHIKIEELNGEILLVVSVPARIKGRILSLELIKTVTDSLIVNRELHREGQALVNVINGFNDLAVRDAFTGLYNMLYIQNEIENRRVDGRSVTTPLAGCHLVIEDFEELVERQGQNLGDLVLQNIARQIKRAINLGGGWAGRLKESEFIIFMENKSKAEMQALCDDIVKKVEAYDFPSFLEGTFHVKIRCVADPVAPAEMAEEYLKRMRELSQMAASICQDNPNKL